MAKKVIVFAPHPDDETCGCGGTIAKKIREGCEVLIVIMTDGRHALSEALGIYSDPTPSELKEIRKEEVKKATRILGVPEENLLFLDFEDGRLRKEEKEAQEKIDEILRKNPMPMEIYYPYEKDCHIDHRLTNRLVKNAIRRLGVHTTEYKYTVVRIYARIGPIIDSFLNLFRQNMIRIDISEFLPLKEAALNEFKSMTTTISNRQEKPLEENPKRFVKKEEIFFVDK
jgi:LmbE family N-acetylglucosaminyl deacetylase